MIRARAGERALMGLTDVNLKRLQAGKPIHVQLVDFGPPGSELPTEVVIFHATREELVKLSDVSGLSAKGLLDQLGEG